MDALPREQREDVAHLLFAYADFWKAHPIRDAQTPFTFDEVLCFVVNSF